MQDNQVMLSGALQSELLELIKSHEQIKSLRTGCLSWQGATDLLRSTLDNTVLKSLVVCVHASEYFEADKAELGEVLEQNVNLTTFDIRLLAADARVVVPEDFKLKLDNVTNRNKLMKKRSRFRTVKVAPPAIGTKRKEKDWDEEQGQSKSSKN